MHPDRDSFFQPADQHTYKDHGLPEREKARFVWREEVEPMEVSRAMGIAGASRRSGPSWAAGRFARQWPAERADMLPVALARGEERAGSGTRRRAPHKCKARNVVISSIGGIRKKKTRDGIDGLMGS